MFECITQQYTVYLLLFTNAHNRHSPRGVSMLTIVMLIVELDGEHMWVFSVSKYCRTKHRVSLMRIRILPYRPH